jgi:hypothetical protein
MTDLFILFPSILGGLTTGAVYALIALGLTLIYGVLHIINFAHGAALMVALYAVYLLKEAAGIDPYLALPIVVPGMFVLGYALQRGRHQPRQPRQGREHPAGDAGPVDRAGEPGADVLQERHTHDRDRLHADHGADPSVSPRP